MGRGEQRARRVPNEYSRPECAEAYQRTRGEGRLYLADPALVAWTFERAGVTARLAVHGTPVNPLTGQEYPAHISIQFEQMSPFVSVALIWDGARILGIDMGGGAHKNLRGPAVLTPHRHRYFPNGRLEAEPFDWAAADIARRDDHEAVVRHFLGWAGLNSATFQWQNPPTK